MKIVGEETCYVDERNKFNLIWIDRLLEGESGVMCNHPHLLLLIFCKQPTRVQNVMQPLFEEPRRTATEYEALLKTFPENTRAMALASQQTNEFNTSYAIVKSDSSTHPVLKCVADKLDHAQLKLEKVIQKLKEVCMFFFFFEALRIAMSICSDDPTPDIRTYSPTVRQ